MPDWTKGMEQTFEYYVVDPGTWKDKSRLTTITSSSISWDYSKETLGSASIKINELIDECYVRIYLVTTQAGVTERFCMGTFLVESPSSEFNGLYTSVSLDAYTPLMELKENQPDLGYTILKDENIMDMAYRLIREHARAPVVATESTETVYDDFVANTDDTWITFISDLIANAKYSLGLDDLGRIIFLPDQKVDAMTPIMTFTDDNSSILYPEISLDHDIYSIPNVVEVVYSGTGGTYTKRVVNDDKDSLTSTINRGREIIYRDTSPSLSGTPTHAMIDDYAEQLLENYSTLTYTVSFSHGYCGTRVGDCVRLNYERAGLKNVKALITAQSIECTPGCKVTETATYTKKLWEGD